MVPSVMKTLVWNLESAVHSPVRVQDQAIQGEDAGCVHVGNTQ